MSLDKGNLFGVCDPWVHELPDFLADQAVRAASDMGCRGVAAPPRLPRIAF